MNTKPTRIPWTKILLEYTQPQGRHLCLGSNTFAELWENPTTKATIQARARQFLQQTKGKYPNHTVAIPGDSTRRHCLFYATHGDTAEQARELRLEFLLSQTKKKQNKI